MISRKRGLKKNGSSILSVSRGLPRRFKLYAAAFLALWSLLVLFSGCLSLVKGEYFLSARLYEKGAVVFKKEIKKEPGKPDNWYYLGRLLLAEEKYTDAKRSLSKAVELDPGSSKYYFWLGVSYGGLKQSASEIKSYQKAIELNPKYYQAHTYLGHSFLRKKRYSDALKSYERALALHANNPSALYNKSLILYRTRQYVSARESFKQYINEYGYSPKSARAAVYLNRMGDFEYRVFRFNKKQVVVKKILFHPENGKLSNSSREALQMAGRMLEKDNSLELHILAYEKNNVTLARKKAVKIKHYIENFVPLLYPEQIKISYFSTPEKISYGKKTYTLDHSIHLFIAPAALIR